MILLDTNTCVGFLKGHPNIVERLGQHHHGEVRLSSVVKAELYYGAWASAQTAKNLLSLERFCRPFVSLSFDDLCAGVYGRLRADLRRMGKPIGPNDMLIATTALAHGLTLVTHNVREFAQVPGLKLEDWEG